MGHVQRTNPMGICCMYKEPIVRGHDAEPDACIEDILLASAAAKCTYAPVSSDSSMSSTKDQLYGNSTCKAEYSCQKESNNTQRVGTSN